MDVFLDLLVSPRPSLPPDVPKEHRVEVLAQQVPLAEKLAKAGLP